MARVSTKKRGAAIAKLVTSSLDPLEKHYTFGTQGEEVAILCHNEWIRGKICITEDSICPAVAETLGAEPQAIPLTASVVAVPLEAWNRLLEQGKISQQSIKSE